MSRRFVTTEAKKLFLFMHEEKKKKARLFFFPESVHPFSFFSSLFSLVTFPMINST